MLAKNFVRVCRVWAAQKLILLLWCRNHTITSDAGHKHLRIIMWQGFKYYLWT